MEFQQIGIPGLAGKAHSDVYDKLRDALREERRKRGISQEDLAAALSKPQPFISKYEHGVRRLDVIEFYEIARAIGFAPEQLITKVLGAGGAKASGNKDHRRKR